MSTYSVADLFSGCGGFSLGFEMEGSFKVNVAIDHWHVSLSTLKRNSPHVECVETDLSDPNSVDDVCSTLKGSVDVLLGGPPCQGFSTLGKRRDGDKRSTLVDSFADMCLKILPKIVIVENVKGITSKRHPLFDNYAEALTQTLNNDHGIGYFCSTRILNTIEFGIAQTRSRWFLIGFRNDLPNAKHLADTFWSSVLNSNVSEKNLADVIMELPPVGPGEEVKFVRKSDGSSQRIYNHRAMRHSNELIERFRHVPPGGGLLDVPEGLLTPHLRKMLNGHYGSGGHVKNIYGRMDWNKPSGTIVAGIDKITCGRFVHPSQDRLLTPRECARIQTFPDEFEFLGGQVAQYYQIGNAVPPKLAEALAGATRESLDAIEQRSADRSSLSEMAA